MTLEQLTDELYAQIRLYKITRDDTCLFTIATLANAIKQQGYKPSYYKRDRGLVISRVETYNVDLQVIDHA